MHGESKVQSQSWLLLVCWKSAFTGVMHFALSSRLLVRLPHCNRRLRPNTNTLKEEEPLSFPSQLGDSSLTQTNDVKLVRDRKCRGVPQIQLNRSTTITSPPCTPMLLLIQIRVVGGDANGSSVI
jgi:hypothetical protein